MPAAFPKRSSLVLPFAALLLAGCSSVAPQPAVTTQVVASAQLTPLNSDLILTTYNSSTPSSVTNYDLAAARSLPETFTLTLLDASGKVILQSAAGAPQVTLCASDPGELSVTSAGSGEYQLRALRSFGSNPSSAQSLYLAVGNCSGTQLTQPGSSTPISLPTVSETQALYVSNDGSFGNGPFTITAYTAHGRELGFSVSGSNSGLSHPAGLAFDSATGWLYVANSSGGTSNTGSITAYDPATGAEIPSSSFSTTSGLDFPLGLAFDPQTGWLYAANTDSSAITAYDPVSGAEISSTDFTSPTASDGLSNPAGLAYAPQTGWLYAANGSSSNSTITAYDPVSGAEISSTDFTSPTSSDGLSDPTFLTVIP